MAVHLNAHLKTRFIPMLFVAAALLSWAASTVHASENTHPTLRPAREELRSLMEEDAMDTTPSTSRSGVQAKKGINRQPGFSPIIYSAEPQGGGRAAIAAQYGRMLVESMEAAEKLKEPAHDETGSSDRISTQPAEALSE